MLTSQYTNGAMPFLHLLDQIPSYPNNFESKSGCVQRSKPQQIVMTHNWVYFDYNTYRSGTSIVLMALGSFLTASIILALTMPYEPVLTWKN